MKRPELVDCGSGVRLERGVPCRMRDGTVLISDHYYPDSENPAPTLLMRQPYGRDIASTVVYAHPVWFAQRGYNVVIQDVRGRGDSEGEFYPFRNESRDGADTIAWLLTRPECNGEIGMYGFSYQGLTQLLAAAEQPEGLVCIAPGMTACDLYRGWFYHNGALRLSSTLGWGLQLLKADARRLGLRRASEILEHAWINVRSQPMTAPYRSHPALEHPGLPGYVLDWFDHDLPGSYWEDLDVSASLDKIQIPALHVAGWFDTYLQGSIDGFVGLCQAAGSQSARDHQYLLAGPWIHIPWGDRAGEGAFGSAALFNTDEHLLSWFNHWLKGSGEFNDEPRIRHFAIGANQWFSAGSWPTDGWVKFYLHCQTRANSRKGDGELSESAPERPEPADIFVYDPEVPVWAPGGPPAASGLFDQNVLELGNNLLVYDSAPLAEPLHVFGSPQVTLYCSSSARAADFAAKLVRVTSAGRAESICIGIARSSTLFPHGAYAADKIHCWQFDIEPTSCVFSAGERIRLEIASSAFPLYDRNPSNETKACLADSWTWQRSTQTVYHHVDHPSHLRLPVGRYSPC
jgi:uncharacterized protein